jgi:hypothetical protein
MNSFTKVTCTASALLLSGGITLLGATAAHADPANEVPDAYDDSYSMTQGDTLTVDAASGLLANDIPTGPSPLAVVEWFDYDPTELVVNPDGSFTYTPQPGFSGLASFHYKAGAGNWWGYSRTVSITVNALPVAPPAVPPVVPPVVPPAAPAAAVTYDDELPTLAYTGTDDVTTWLLAPAAALLALGGLGVWVSRRRAELS